MKTQGEVKKSNVRNKTKTLNLKESTLANVLRKFLGRNSIKYLTLRDKGLPLQEVLQP